MADSVLAAPPAVAPMTDRGGVLRWVCVVFALFGWWLSAELTWQSLGQVGNSILVQALCAGDAAGGNCRSVIATEWGAVQISPNQNAPRLPTAAFGMAYFAAIALWLLFAGLPARRRLAWHIPFLLFLLIGTLTSVNLLYVMGGVLKRWCLACTSVHMLNLALVLLVFGGIIFRRLASVAAAHLTPSAALSALTASVLVLLLHLSFVFAAVISRSALPLQAAYNKIINDSEFAKWQYERQPVVEFPSDADVASDGPADAPNTIVFFSDFQCPACKRAHTLLHDTLAERPDQIRVVYRHYPLNTACNPNVPMTKHPAACSAALAAEAVLAAGSPQAAKSMRERLYERQDEARPAAFARWADEFGVDPKRFADARDSQAVADRIARDVALAQKIGVTATPVVFLNGRRFDYWMNDAAWREVLGLPAKPTAASGPAR
jgi:protein-disulfide isomerase/uncharacterized membrane protein